MWLNFNLCERVTTVKSTERCSTINDDQQFFFPTRDSLKKGVILLCVELKLPLYDLKGPDIPSPYV